MKKIIKYFLLGLSFFIISQKRTEAANEFELEYDASNLTYRIEKEDKSVNLYFTYVKDKETKEFVYCLEPGVALSPDVYTELEEWQYKNLNLTEEQKNYITQVAYFGYNYQGHENIYYYYAAQLLIWEKIIPNNWQIYYTNALDGEKVAWFSKEKQEIISLIEKDNRVSSLKDKTYTWNILEPLTLQDANQVIENYYFRCDGNNQINHWGNNLIINSYSTEIQTVEFIKEYQGEPLKFYYRDNAQNLLRKGKMYPKTFQMTLKPYKLAIEIQKVDENQQPIENVEFEITANENLKNSQGEIQISKGTVIQKQRTDENGLINIDNLWDGEYCVKETDTPKGYLKNEAEKCFTLNKNNQKQVLKIENKKQKQNLIIEKLDEETKQVLKGVHFKVTNEKKETVFDGLTDNNGQIIIENLPLGSYTIEEIATLDGYIPNKENKTVVLDGKEKVKQITLTNKRKKQTLILKKQDKETKQALSGVYFKITNQKKECIFEGPTNEEGMIILKNLPLDIYTIEEIIEKEGYIKNSKPIIITLDGKEKEWLLELTNERKKQNLVIKKQDEKTKESLKNVRFKIYNEKKECIFDGFTDEEGKIKIENLDLGTYLLEEIETIEGYELTKETITIYLDGEIETKEIIVTNHKIENVPNTEEYITSPPMYLYYKKRKKYL